MHRDLKPSNILVNLKDDGSHEIKLADFGQSVVASERGNGRAERPKGYINDGEAIARTMGNFGTKAFRAPEIVSAFRW